MRHRSGMEKGWGILFDQKEHDWTFKWEPLIELVLCVGMLVFFWTR